MVKESLAKILLWEKTIVLHKNMYAVMCGYQARQLVH